MRTTDAKVERRRRRIRVGHPWATPPRFAAIPQATRRRDETAEDIGPQPIRGRTVATPEEQNPLGAGFVPNPDSAALRPTGLIRGRIAGHRTRPLLCTRTRQR